MGVQDWENRRKGTLREGREVEGSPHSKTVDKHRLCKVHGFCAGIAGIVIDGMDAPDIGRKMILSNRGICGDLILQGRRLL